VSVVTTTIPTHARIEPGILYFGTPVVLISTLNEDGSPNLAPMSSAFWLGWRAMLGLGGRSKTTQNMLRTGECVLNLPARGVKYRRIHAAESGLGRQRDG
jgi:flavin reductase (DIM6/NTAB) family NADH-FMN oxidoreductase RutF